MTFKPLIALAAIASMGAFQASAVTVDILYLNATAVADGVSNGSGSEPVAVATSTGTRINQGTVDTMTVTAAQNANGFSSLDLSVDCAGSSGLACSGVGGEIENSATVIRALRFTNDSGVAQDGTFSFRLSGIELETFTAAGGMPEASLTFTVGATNGATYEADITTRARPTGSGPVHEVVSATNFSASIALSECVFGFCYRGTATVNPLSSSISLGTLAPGQSVDVFTTFFASTNFFPFEDGAQLRAVDPGSYSWSFTPAGTPPPAPVPLPAGGVLILTALGGLAVLRSRKT